MELIASALASGARALTEYQSKQVLAHYGVPVTREALAGNAAEAADAAAAIGFPVAVKASSSELLHKSDTGAVALGLETPAAVTAAVARIEGAVGVRMDGVLVQEMIAGQRELVVGLHRDPQFGPCVMLGTGGIFTEIIRDTVFRAAPVDAVEAMDMVDELKTRAMLDAFRGQAPADIDAICRILTAVGRVGIEVPEVAEIDINPLIITPDGAVVAVDALVVLEERKAR